MKKVFSILVAIFIGVITIISCKEEEQVIPAKKVALDKYNVSIAVGEKTQVEIKQGNGGYKVKSLSPAMVSAKLILDYETNKKYIVLKGKSSGESKVVITDSRDEKAEIKVSVIAGLNLPQDEVSLGKGAMKDFPLNGTAKDFDVSSSDDSIVKAEIKNGKLVLTAVGSGKAKITVTDKRTGVKTVMAINVPEAIKDVTIEKTEITIAKGAKEVIEITAGSGDYNIKSSKNEVATAEIKGGTVVVKALKKGEATITITDKVTKKEATIKVTVTEDYADVTLKDTEITIAKGDKEVVEITTGSGKYTVESNKQAVATAEIVGSTVKVTAVAKGVATITVTDTKTNKTAKVKVTVSTDAFVINKETATLKLGEEIVVYIKSGSGKYEVTGDDFVGASLNGTEITLTAKKVGKGTVTVKDTEGRTSKTIEVTVEGNLTLNKESVNIEKGKTADIVITSGSSNYSVVSKSPDVATVKNTNGTITITGVAKGTTKITVTDKGTKETKEISVTVNVEDLAVSKTEVTFGKVGATEVVTINTGEAGTITYSKEDIATAEIKGGTVIIKSLKKGTTIITIKDVNGGSPAKITVNVTDNDYADLTLDTKNLIVKKDGKGKVVVTAGSGKYRVKPNNEAIATAVVNGSVIEITGVSKGSTFIEVTDLKTYKKDKISVTVSTDAFVISKESVTLKLGETETIIVKSGSGNYEIGTSEFVDVTEDNDELTITAKKVGTGKVTVKDADANETKEISVTVTGNLELSTESVTVQKGMTNIVVVKSGTGDYNVNSSDDTKATAIVENGNITITGVAKGTAKITVTDNGTEETKEIAVTVSVDEFALLETETEITLREKENTILHIIKGSGSYEVTSSNEKAATVNRDGNTITITAGDRLGEPTTDRLLPFKPLETIIVVTDTEANVSKEITVKVFKKLSLGTKVIDIKQGDYGNSSIVAGDKEHITVTIDNEEIASYEIVEVNGLPEIKFTGLKPGTTFAIVTDGSGVEKVVAITVKAIEPVKIVDFNGENVTNVEVTEDTPGELTLKDGSGQYDITYAPEGIVTADAQTFGDSGFLSITAIGTTGGQVVVTLTDRISGDTAQVTANVKVKIPLSFTYMKGGQNIEPSEVDGDQTPWFHTKVGDIVKIIVKGGSESGYKIIMEGGETSAIEYIGGVTGKDLTTQDSDGNYYVEVKMKSVTSSVYFNIRDSEGNRAKYFGFKIEEAPVDNSPFAKVETDASKFKISGNVAKKKENLSGDILLPASVTKISTASNPITYTNENPFKKNTNITTVDLNNVTVAPYKLFDRCSALTAVAFRKVETLEGKLFDGCKALTDVYCYMQTPPKFHVRKGKAQEPFKYMKAGVVLHVPTGTKQAYIDAGFTMFSNIVEDAN